MMVTTRSRNDCNGVVQIDGEIVEAIKYMGVMLDEMLNFNEHVNYTIRKAARKLGVLYRINRYLTFDNKVTVFINDLSNLLAASYEPEYREM